MTLPTTGTLGLNQVNLELFRAETALIGLNDAEVRGLAETPTGAVTFANLRGKSYLFAFTIATNQSDANLRTLALAAGWNGISPLQATINSGVTIGGSVAGNSTPALTINGSFPNGVLLINNGIIAGRGGAGSTTGPAPAAGQAGGLALAVSVPVTIQNNGTIAGGGGGGGAGASFSGTGNCDMGESSCNYTRLGGGGGGGRSNAIFTAAGGSVGGGTGTGTTNGAGGTGTSSTGVCPSCVGTGPSGGAGGGWGTAGASSLSGVLGGAAGLALTGNANITWTAFGTRLGPIT